MEVRFLPPERAPRRCGTIRTPRPGMGVGRDHNRFPFARAGGACRRQRQADEVRRCPKCCTRCAAGPSCGMSWRRGSPPALEDRRSSWATAPTRSRAPVRSWGLTPAPVFVAQAEQLGTGHAVMVAEKAVGHAADVLVANGDFDPVPPRMSGVSCSVHRRSTAACGRALAELDRAGQVRARPPRGRLVAHRRGGGYHRVGRVLRSTRSRPTGWCSAAPTCSGAPALDRANRQHEYYLNRVIPILRRQGSGWWRCPRHGRRDGAELPGRLGRGRARGPRPDQRGAPWRTA